ncbi:extensin-like [Callorhinchus milii]|uniref:extensin-like n=1 Tax=Callorhinchus milii TaxID=7868 RepID=UPI001C3F583B|nr:extensin-like [Callorhinchus milii]
MPNAWLKSRNNLDQKINNGHSNPTFQIKNKDDVAKTGPRHSPALPPKPRLPYPVYSPQPVLILPALKPTSPALNSHQNSRVPSPATPGQRPPPPLRNSASKPTKPAPPNRPLPVDPIPRTPKGLQRPKVPPKDPLNNSPAPKPRMLTSKKALLPPTAQKQLENRINSETNPFKRDHS